MTNLSNLYSEKVLSEHPLVMWPLSDELGYISLVSEANRTMSSSSQWVGSNCSISNSTTTPANAIFLDSITSKITGSVPTEPTINFDISGQFIVNTNNFDLSLSNVTMGFYLYIDNPYTKSVSFGYKYTDPGTSQELVVTKTLNLLQSSAKKWIFVSDTLNLPQLTFNDLKLFVSIEAKSGGIAGDYNYYINGLTFGQWAEEFNNSSLGITPVIPPTSIPYSNIFKVVEAVQYGSGRAKGYYLANDKKLFAKNYGVPLTYGSSNVTKIYPNKLNNISYPSLIVPGEGFLNRRGQYNSYTAEMWLKVNTDTKTPKKIFGPIGSSDGLYVDGGLLSFVFNNKIGSHYVGRWARPMLVHIRYIDGNLSVLLNGEQVINLSYLESSISLPSEYDQSGKNQDWLGFYSYEDVYLYEIDSFALYSYSVPNEVAKRRWVWGQGVTPPENANYSLNSTTAFSDYSFANHSVNYNYPDFANWNQGFSSNLKVSSTLLQLPDYKLPRFILGSKTYDSLISDIRTQQESMNIRYFTFRPNSGWNNESCYIDFGTVNMLLEPTAAMYGIFRTDGNAINQTLFKITNKATKDTFSCIINGTQVSYVSKISGTTTTINSQSIVSNQWFSAGINIKSISQSQVPGLSTFFATLSNLSLTVSGDSSGTFTGDMLSFGFDSFYNLRKIAASNFNTNGVLKTDLSVATFLQSHISNYKLVMLYKYGVLFADIACSGYWQDYVPLSYLGKQTKDPYGVEHYDLDSIQVNMNYPAALEKSSETSEGSWTYQDLKIRYRTVGNSSSLQTYSELDNNIYSGWSNYDDMANDSEKYYTYNTDNNTVRGFISFQKVSEGSNKTILDFANIEKMNVNGVVDGTISRNGWETSAFEIIDGTIVYAPETETLTRKPIDFNKYSLVYHVDFVSDGLLHNPVVFRDFQLASKVLERDSFSKIGTKFGTDVYPYSRSGKYYSYKAKNPISVYKGSTPHLYLDNSSGWGIKGKQSAFVERGISIPVNSQKSSNFRIGNIQFWMKFSDSVFPTSDTLILSIEQKNSIYDFYLISDASTARGKIYGKDRETNQELKNISFSINGNLVTSPYITSDSWNAIGIGFKDLLDFDQTAGLIKISGPIMFNNFSYFLANGLQQQQQKEIRVWSDIKEMTQSWSSWKSALDLNSDGDYVDSGEHDGTWFSVSIISSTDVYNVEPSIIYSQYVGTNRIVIDDEVDGILVKPEKIKAYSGPSWSVFTKIPV